MRADMYLYKYGYAESREAGRKAIAAGLCVCDGKMILKPSENIDETAAHKIDYKPAVPYVGRGGLKLEAALDRFDIDPAGKDCLDIGASTGGFTDCLLRRGAKKVFAIDSGCNQLASKLKSDQRVVSIEGYNARNLSPSDIGVSCAVVVMDVSFISQTLILPRIPSCMTPDACLITLIKPQFECGRSMIGKGGIVRDSKARRDACRRVSDYARQCGLSLAGLMVSPISGGDGNREFLAYFKNDSVASGFDLSFFDIDY